MPYKYICANHAKLVANDVNAAQKYWTLFMERGRSAYSDCRWQGAEIYLSAAIDVAAIRLLVPNDQSFGFSNILRPLRMLCQLYIADLQSDKAWNKVEYVRLILTKLEQPSFISAVLKDFCESISLDVKGVIGNKNAGRNSLQLLH